MGAADSIDNLVGNSPKDLTSHHGYCSSFARCGCGDPCFLTVLHDLGDVRLPHPGPPCRSDCDAPKPRYKVIDLATTT